MRIINFYTCDRAVGIHSYLYECSKGTNGHLAANSSSVVGELRNWHIQLHLIWTAIYMDLNTKFHDLDRQRATVDSSGGWQQ